MTSRDFIYWLQGYFEISGDTEVDKDKTKLIKKHLAMVFKHEIDPSHGDLTTQTILNEIHGGNDSERPTVYRC